MRKLSMDELNRKSVNEFKDAEKINLIIVLDNVRSNHNIGSVFRTADAFLVEAVYLCGISSTPPNNEIRKTALGAEESVNWKYFENTVDAIAELKTLDYKILALEQVENSISLIDFKAQQNDKYALIFGHEVKGVSQDVLNNCDASIEIPQFGTKHSFNISISVGIVLWEFFRKLKT